MSRIVLKRLNADYKFLFRKLEKDLKYYTKLNADFIFWNNNDNNNNNRSGEDLPYWQRGEYVV